MKVKVSNATGKALDWMVANAEGATGLHFDTCATWWFTLDGKDRCLSSGWSASQCYYPSTNWAHGGLILTRERISRTIDHSGLWVAYWTDGVRRGDEVKEWMQCDRSELIAGLRCYVTSKLGDEVEVPEGVMQ